jgi:hypothetical protein
MINVIMETIQASLKKAGFRKKSNTWYLHTDETILVTNVQKSNYGDSYYINLAVWLNSLGDILNPKHNHCHIQMRAVNLDRDRQNYWEREVFNLENTKITENERTELIRSFFENIAIPFLFSCSSLEGIRKQHIEGCFKGAFFIIPKILLEKLPSMSSTENAVSPVPVQFQNDNKNENDEIR